MKYALRGLLDSKYINHLELLSASIYILSKENVTVSEIDYATKLLNTFCDQYEDFYGLRYALNTHLLRHCGSNVKKTGPLWCHSLFGFESNMGVLKKYCNCGVKVLEQITHKYIIAESMCNKKENPTEQSFKFTINLNLPTKHDSLLIEYGLEVNGKIAKTTQVSKGKTVYKSIWRVKPPNVLTFLLK